MQPPFFLHFNHYLAPYLHAVHTLVTALTHLIEYGIYDSSLFTLLLDRRLPTNSAYVHHALRTLCSKAEYKPVFELYLKELVKFTPSQSQLVKSTVLEHFVRREVARRMREEAELESMEELVYRLPFKMKVQTLMEDNKAYGDRTKEDVEKMEREAKREIERNFPSYFDQIQRIMFSGIVEEPEERKKRERKAEEVKAEAMLEGLLHLTTNYLPTPADVRRSLSKHRLKLLHALHSTSTQHQLTHFHMLPSADFLMDVSNYLREDLT